ncbi:peroxidase 46-like [Cucurbita pepo subsp. pepo]|uniref:peroxidase 46-like n=1 Tax=Cucurbita pepo subsp. pepo TaxID=3664 RepID=UPI000C9D705B|nr:peroxidase 46-like [Cucurbita pepo subsp. pepo]
MAKAASCWKICCKFFVLLGLFLPATATALSFGFYSATCPAAELIVKNAVRSASSEDPTVPGKLLRLMFHDCFVEGCDASILLQGNETERTDPANKSLGGFEAIDSAKRTLEFFCPGIVSCADVVVLAARDAVEFAGGPSVEVPTGRRDGRISAATNVRPNIVDTSFSVDQMMSLFSSKGLSADDLVILSGAHTIGTAHCSAFNDRFRKGPNGQMTLIDASLDGTYANELMQRCPAGAASTVVVDNDPATANVFDNQYYKNILSHKGLFQSDSILISDGRTRAHVERFAKDQIGFFENWGQSFLKLSSVGVKSGDEGEIRLSCSTNNV